MTVATGCARPTVAGDMEMAPDQPRFMDETVVVESKAVAIRARRATVHQREARQGMLSPRRGQGFGGLVPGRRRIGWEIDWDSCANAWTRQGGKAIRCLQALQARAFVQLAEDCGVMSLTSVTLPYAISALEGAGLDMNSPWSRGCHGRAHCLRVLSGQKPDGRQHTATARHTRLPGCGRG